MDRTNLIGLAIGVLVAALVGYTLFTGVAADMDKTEQWCEDHDGEVTFHDEVMICELPNKTVTSGELKAKDYPENASVLDGIDGEKPSPAPLFTPEVVIPVLGTLAFGMGITYAVGRYQNSE